MDDFESGVFQCTEVGLMSAGTLSDELCGCRFGDARLNKRACKVIDALGQKPIISIPAALAGRADFEACYRLMDNEKTLQTRFSSGMPTQLTKDLTKKTMS